MTCEICLEDGRLLAYVPRRGEDAVRFPLRAESFVAADGAMRRLGYEPIYGEAPEGVLIDTGT